MQRNIKEKNRISIKGSSDRGFTTMENHIIELPYLNPSARCLLNVFFRYQNCDETFVGYTTLQRYTGIGSKTTITKWLKFLQWIGFLDIERCKDEQGILYNIYTLNHNRILDLYRYFTEVDITFIEIENYWNKKASTPTDANKLLKNKESFINTMKEILSK